MEKNKRIIIIIIITGLLVITSIIAIFLSISQGSGSTNSNINNNTNNSVINNTISNNTNPSSNPELETKITRLKDFNKYYWVQNAINNFYSLGLQNNAKDIIKLLLKEYVNEHNLNENNVINFLNISDENVIFYAESMYYNANSKVTYYFVEGYTISYPILDGDVKYNANVNYLLIVDDLDNYALMPLSNVTNLEEYANNYNIKNISLNNDMILNQQSLAEKEKIASYINSFSNLMYLDANKTYNMLDDTTKKTYPDINSFINNMDTINNNLFTKFFATSTKKNKDNTIYKVQNHNGDTITITEYYPYNFKIGFEFLPNRYE